MEALVLDTDFNAVGIMDTYISFIWTDRYAQYGDFEIYTPSSLEVLNLMKPKRYLWFKQSEHVMIIEGFETKTDAQDGNTIAFTGRSLESILDRRIVWVQTSLSGNLQNGVKTLLNENIINPSNADRKIENFIFEESTDEAITSLTLSAQYTGDNLYDVIASICKENNIGFKVTLNENNQFVFKLYKGVDRTYDQTDNVYVVFSPDYENIINSDYIESIKTLKNVTLVAGEGEGADRRVATLGTTTGLERRELFTDARDISSTVDGGTISDAEYNNQLIQRGGEKLAECKTVRTYDGEMDMTHSYQLYEDFGIGDVVQIRDEFDIESTARITEFIFSKNVNEESSYPTFEIIEFKDDETVSGSTTGTMGSSGETGSGSAAGSTAVYTKNDVDNLFLKINDLVDFTKEEIDAICKF